MIVVCSMSCPPCLSYLLVDRSEHHLLCHAKFSLAGHLLELSIYLKGQHVTCYLPFGKRLGVPFNINIDVICNAAAHNMAPLPLDGRGSSRALCWRP